LQERRCRLSSAVVDRFRVIAGDTQCPSPATPRLEPLRDLVPHVKSVAIPPTDGEYWSFGDESLAGLPRGV